MLDEVYATPMSAGHPVPGHRLRDGGARQGRRQLLPGHEDLVHQRDGGGMRGRPAMTSHAWLTRSATTSASAAGSSAPASGSAAAACPRTSARSRRPPAELGVVRWLDFLLEVDRVNMGRRERWSTGPRRWARLISAVRSRCWVRRSSRTPTTCGTPRRSRCRASLQGGARAGHRSRRPSRTRRASGWTCTSPTPRSRRQTGADVVLLVNRSRRRTVRPISHALGDVVATERMLERPRYVPGAGPLAGGGRQ